LAERFLALGNCWPLEEDLPEHFRWIIPSQLAGMARPGMLREANLDLDALAGAGITLLVSLTETTYPVAELRQYGIASRHFPIADMGVPSLGPTASLCGYLERTIVGGGRVAVHCHAGLGRTGLILASFLVWLGEAPTSAIESVRAVRPQYIQTKPQAEFVHRFAEQVGVSGASTRRTLVEARGQVG
jgi:atypical dual specificity phosphatase